MRRVPKAPEAAPERGRKAVLTQWRKYPSLVD